MLYAWLKDKKHPSIVHITRISGMTLEEEKRMVNAGWTIYWTTDRKADRDGYAAAGVAYPSWHLE